MEEIRIKKKKYKTELLRTSIVVEEMLEENRKLKALVSPDMLNNNQTEKVDKLERENVELRHSLTMYNIEM